ncbi:lysozyme [Solimonas sp. K1W22B-7]|uniref:lysozyme n=1 Tax=Solimonas sp. K1W22B-7 TaxID=2303331 RepID=UPI0013C455B9|nr:lysozyme [Solimonas sp. K1W22B-7]
MNPRSRAALAGTALLLAIPAAKILEGKSNRAYLDVAAVPTACYGQTGPRVRMGEVYSDLTCERWLHEQLLAFHQGIRRCVTQPMSPPQAAALTLFAYNVGLDGACGSAAVRHANRGDWKSACRALQYNERGQPAWSYVTDAASGRKRFVQGLANRRAAERALCERAADQTADRVVSIDTILVKHVTDHME